MFLAPRLHTICVREELTTLQMFLSIKTETTEVLVEKPVPEIVTV